MTSQAQSNIQNFTTPKNSYTSQNQNQNLFGNQILPQNQESQPQSIKNNSPEKIVLQERQKEFQENSKNEKINIKPTSSSNVQEYPELPRRNHEEVLPGEKSLEGTKSESNNSINISPNRQTQNHNQISNLSQNITGQSHVPYTTNHNRGNSQYEQAQVQVSYAQISGFHNQIQQNVQNMQITNIQGNLNAQNNINPIVQMGNPQMANAQTNIHTANPYVGNINIQGSLGQNGPNINNFGGITVEQQHHNNKFIENINTQLQFSNINNTHNQLKNFNSVSTGIPINSMNFVYNPNISIHTILYVLLSL